MHRQALIDHEHHRASADSVVSSSGCGQGREAGTIFDPEPRPGYGALPIV
jgi:hypothetical protein